MKFVEIFFIVACFQAITCGPVNKHQVEVENQRSFDIIGGFLAVVNQLIATMTKALEDVEIKTRNWIQKEIGKIENAVANSINDFNQYIEQVKAELNALMNNLNPCLEEVPEKIRNAKNETAIEIKACHEDGLSKLSQIQQDIKNYRDTKQAAINGAISYIQSCSDQPDFGDKIKCAVDASRNISSTVRVLQENIASTSEIISGRIRNALAENHECVARALQAGQLKIQVILEEARQCLEDLNTSTTEPTTASDGIQSSPENSDTTAIPSTSGTDQ